jgi:hypothetical protein
MATDIGGVWRTVGGRRIFIKDGEDLSTAMKKSGKFGNKKSFNETIKSNGYQKTIDVNNSNKKIEHYDEYTEETILEIEKNKIGSKKEIGTIISHEGTVLKEINGESHSVDVQNEDKNLFKNNIFTHNHPMGGNFSTEDINSFLEYDLYELRASTDSGVVYSIRKGNDKVDSIGFAKAFTQANPKGYTNCSQRLQNDIKSGKIDINSLPYNERGMYATLKAGDRNMDDWLKENAKKYGFVYKKEE